MTEKEAPVDPLKVLVLDAGAFITQAKFDQFGPEVTYVTLAAIVATELKDENARQVYRNFPFPIETRIPSSDAVKAIIDFSKKTGDFPHLSSVDINVLALSYMFERERNGLKRIRQEPAKRVIPSAEKKSTAVSLTSDTSATSATSTTSSDDTAPITPPDTVLIHTSTTAEGDSTGGFQDEAGAHEDEGDNEEEIDEQNGTEQGEEPRDTEATTGETTAAQSDPFWGDDSEGEWITPENIQRHKHGVKKSEVVEDLSDVACITTDYAMQNVLIGMGLRLLSVNGLSITSIRQHVRRCHACWAVEWSMEKTNNFCRNCGGHTLLKAVFTIDADGVPQYHMSQKAINNKRGTVYSIPKFKGGRHKTDLILREDALKSTKLHAHKKKEENAFEDSIEFGWGTVGSQVNTQQAPEQFGYGRRNPNVVQPGKRDKNKRNHRRK